MARIRAIKPGFFKDSDLFDAERGTGLPLRLAYAGLWTVADREGRFKWKPREIKTDVLPYDECDMDKVLDALITAGKIFRYKCAGEEFGFIPTFLEHQHINLREPASTIPAPPENRTTTRAKVVRARASTCGREGNDNGKGREGDAPAALPDWVPKDAWDAFVEMRARSKAPLTPEAKRLTLKDLEKLRAEGHDPQAVLEASVKNAWRGLFPLKEKTDGRSRTSQQPGRGIRDAATAALAAIERDQGATASRGALAIAGPPSGGKGTGSSAGNSGGDHPSPRLPGRSVSIAEPFDRGAEPEISDLRVRSEPFAGMESSSGVRAISQEPGQQILSDTGPIARAG